jgi:H+-translocating NAD(P) transhydrogenase subunit alpha
MEACSLLSNALHASSLLGGTMIIAVPRESGPKERRVALVPETASRLAKLGATVRVQRGAGTAAAFTDEAYEQAGAALVDDAPELVADADAVITVGRPSDELLGAMRPTTTVVGFLNPLGDPPYLRRLADAKLTAIAMEMIPRITRAQSMDALSSQSNIAGYKAVLLAAGALPKFFPMLTTAAGTIPPSKALILGAGVAGLQAIATARRLGAVVSGYDVRSVVKEQVQSLGATFLEFDLGSDAETAGGYAKELTPEQQERQRAWMVEQIGANDVVITTALVPGRKAPILVSETAVAAMKPGSVIVDLAAEAGGNVALTVPDETVTSPNGVTIVGTTNLPSTMPADASRLYSRNIYALLSPWIKDGSLTIDMNDDVAKGAVVVHDGSVLIGGITP